MGARVERLLPLLVGLVGPALIFLYLPSAQLLSHARWERLFSDTATLGGIIVGFLATAKAILFALPDRPTIQFLRESKHLQRLVQFLFDDIMLWLAVCVSGFALSFAGDKLSAQWARVAIMIWSWAAISGVACFIRSIRLVSRLLEIQASTDK